MICKNHERQPSFWGVAVEKLVKNSENSALTLRGRVCLSKSTLFFLLETLCNGRDNQVSSQPACLCFMVQLQKIIGHAHKIPFHHDIGIPRVRKRRKFMSSLIMAKTPSD